ncbi:MAG: hypothetical protein Q8P18_23365 [Pseudomonadota bacterium]|nr:hypothetical protein [Pseudomonadota bacterium]
MRTLCALAMIGGCAPAEADPVDPGRPVDPLYLPDVSGIDLPVAYTDAFVLALDVRTANAWAGHVATLGMRTAGCPDLWVGAPGDTLEIDQDAPGVSWADHCDNGLGVDFSGAMYWDTSVDIAGDTQSAEGRTSSAERTLIGDATVGEGADARFELDGEASDAVSLSEAADYSRYTWSSLVAGTVTGSEVFAGSSTPGGYRTDLYLYAEGGEAERLEARGNIYLYEDLLADRFDSVAMDLAFVGPTNAAPTDCTLEPTGWLSLRDADAFWYDLVFLPADAETLDTGVSAACDGCGELYVRGVASGQVCVDLSLAWDGRLAPPSIADFALSLHDL